MLPVPVDTILAQDPLLAPLASNGGPTATHALLSGSPAIDAGNNSQGASFDQRGSGYSRVIGAAPDIGAYELGAGTRSSPTASTRSNDGAAGLTR